jgi:hypothetical protein
MSKSECENLCLMNIVEQSAGRCTDVASTTFLCLAAENGPFNLGKEGVVTESAYGWDQVCVCVCVCHHHTISRFSVRDTHALAQRVRYIHRVGQNRVYALYLTIYLVISLP